MLNFLRKATIGYSTTTPWENENMEKTDDPDVFEFSVTEVKLNFFNFKYSFRDL